MCNIYCVISDQPSTSTAPGIPTWGEWTFWSECSVLCESGTRIELDNVKEKCVKVNRVKVEIATWTLVVSRTFYKSNNQSMIDLKLLGTWRSDHVHNLLFHAFIAGRWSDWSVWSECSKTCGSGRNTRSRTCEERSCVGTVTQERSCNTFACFLTSKHIL